MILQLAIVVVGGAAAIAGFALGYPDHGAGVAAGAAWLLFMTRAA